ncbi:MAG: hypothetical protein KKD07_09885 [Candidatus Omnitrophica bacterium]|nr:hypothetical protein [Candidatus Omnitrophota bacterium]MBU4334737.1 hypothetical protein [Candidatus Omnitrophota bacterium]
MVSCRYEAMSPNKRYEKKISPTINKDYYGDIYHEMLKGNVVFTYTTVVL